MSHQVETNIVYVILCEDRVLFSGITIDVDRREKEQFSGRSRTSKFLLKNKPLVLIRKFKCKNKKLAIKSAGRINRLKGEQKKDFIRTAVLNKPKPLNLVEVSKNHFEACCRECGFKSIIKCKYSDLEVEMLNFECIHEAVKDKIDSLFEQAILGAICFNNGRFMFVGKHEDRARDYLLGFSERGHRQRTMAAYDTLDEICFKNTYLLLSAILEEIYYLIKEYADQYSKCELEQRYTRSTFKRDAVEGIIQGSHKIRFREVAQLVQLIANVIKHSGGIIKEEESGKVLISEFNLEKGQDIVALRNQIKIDGTQISNIDVLITRLYVFIFDWVAHIFEFKKFHIKDSEFQDLISKIVNYEVRETYEDFLRQVQQDGSVIFPDFQDK